MMFSSFLAWAPSAIRDTLRVSDLATGLITGASACLAAAAMLAIAVTLDRTGERCLHASAAALLIAFAYGGAALIPNPVGRVACLALVSAGAMGFSLAFWSVSTSLLRGAAAAGGIALVNSLGQVGGLVGPAMIGRIKDATGDTRAGFLVLAALALVQATLFLSFRRRPAFASANRGRVAIVPPLVRAEA
jgi:MFS transporter, ACS family, tartrate transporter